MGSPLSLGHRAGRDNGEDRAEPSFLRARLRVSAVSILLSV
jgi:hypothetical protein